MNWGKWIIVAFVLFAAFIATLVTVCMRQDVSLVSKNYYQDELAYQQQIVRMNNVNQLASKPVIKKTGGYLELDFNDLNKIENGELALFSPADANNDKTYAVAATEASKQIFPINDVAQGVYRARLRWAMNGKEYFFETIIRI